MGDSRWSDSSEGWWEASEEALWGRRSRQPAGAPWGLCCPHYPWEPHLGRGLWPSTPPALYTLRGGRRSSHRAGPLGEPDPGSPTAVLPVEDLCCALIPGGYLWGPVCKHALSASAVHAAVGAARPRGTSAVGRTWGQAVMACCKGQLPPTVRALVGRSGLRARVLCARHQHCLPAPTWPLPPPSGPLSLRAGAVGMEGGPVIGDGSSPVCTASCAEGALPFAQTRAGPAPAPCAAALCGLADGPACLSAGPTLVTGGGCGG